MFGISWSEMLFLMVLALLLFGGKRIPELARSMGRGISEFKKGVRDFEDEMTSIPEQKQAALPSVTPVAANSSQPFKFDPYTGKPLAKFDPYTGKPLTDDAAPSPEQPAPAQAK